MLATSEIGTSGAEAVAAVLAGFQSLGDNCEFGIVQRYVGIEPSGLFRFVVTPLPALIAGLDSDFAAFGAPGDLEIVAGPSEFLSCHSRTFGFIYNTGVRAGTIDPVALLTRHEERIAYLKARLLGFLKSGEKIFVRKGRPGESLDDVRALARAVQRHGPTTILRVRAAESGETPGSVRLVADGVMEGLVRRFSPYQGGMDIDLEPWIALCRNAHWLAQGRSGRPPSLRWTDRPLRLRDSAAAHVTAPDEVGTTIRTRDLGLTLKPDTVYAFSLWVWIPRDFTGEEVFAVFGRLRLAWLSTDLNLPEAWQRVWISIRTPAEPIRPRVGFGARAPGGQRFWSTGWRLTEGPVPADSPAPACGIGRAWSRWLPRWGR